MRLEFGQKEGPRLWGNDYCLHPSANPSYLSAEQNQHVQRCFPTHDRQAFLPKGAPTDRHITYHVSARRTPS